MKQSFFEKIKKATQAFAVLSFLWLLLIILLSIYEVLFNGMTHEFPKDTGTVIGASMANAVGFWLKCTAWLYLLFTAFYFISPRLSHWLFYIISALLFIIQIGLVQYFATALVPLGADFFSYSSADMKQTVGASGGISSSMVLTLLLFLIAFIFVFYKFRNRNKMWIKVAAVFPLVSVTFLLSSFSPSTIFSPLKTEYARNLAMNKPDFFFTQSYKHFFPETIEEDIYSDSYSGDFGEAGGQLIKFAYTNEQEYPFLHTDETGDVLSPFFNKSNKAPNIVIILVEGLGRAFTNEGAYLGNFTPFLDSLSKQSLYWKNFLSQGGRTFAVLPSLLGSLPFAKNGFEELGEKMPSHLSLLSLAKFNGYRTSFFYGGDSRFDNMNIFLKKNAIDAINDEATFSKNYNRMPSQNGFNWGYGDQELFRRYFEVQKEDSAQPQLNVLLTVSTHSPFLINEQKKYAQRFEERMQQLNFTENKKKEYRSYKDQYASILYCDDALRMFFDAYKSRSDFANTIFLVTGDHRMPEIPMSTKIDRYHVPLLIFSPLLNRTASFASVSSHFDIAPSLLSFLHTNYNFQKPALAAWIGNGLDTTRAFVNNHLYPLMQTKNDLVDFVMGTYHLNGEKIFSISENMDEVPLQDNDKFNQLLGAFNQFKKRNEKIIEGAKLIPDSVYVNYFPH
jgi:uncharacterized sulfatase